MANFSHLVILALGALTLGHAKPAYAGAANALVTCKGTDKGSAVELIANVPGDFAEYTVALKYGALEKTWSDTGNPMILSVADFRRRVFVIGLADEFYLYADPNTVQSATDKSGQHAHFLALLSAPALGGVPNRVRVKCTYEYAI